MKIKEVYQKTTERVASLSEQLVGLEPKTFYYDWIYVNTLRQHPDLCEQVVKYDMFTDIEFNHRRSVNCQAHAVAMYVALVKYGLLETVFSGTYEEQLAKFKTLY